MEEFTFSIPSLDEGPTSLSVPIGGMVFILGANGSGKSSLIHTLSLSYGDKVRKISAYRQIWMNSSAVEITAAAREHYEQNSKNYDTRADARFKERGPNERLQSIIFDLIEAENTLSRHIATAVRKGESEDIERLSKLRTPLDILNQVLSLSNIKIQIKISERGKLLAVKEGVTEYGVDELSDGERNAAIIAATVLTAKEGALIIIDEPERHLHRSITSPLLNSLLSQRPDCAFVVSTHDVELVHDNKAAHVLLVRKYRHNPKGWDIDLVSIDQIDENVVDAILGSRRKILFVEGRAGSLDNQIFSLLFSEITVKPVGNCIDVIRHVDGVLGTRDHHRASGIGLIDRDFRSDTEVEELKQKGVFALDLYSVEGLYYHPELLHLMAAKKATVDGFDPDEVMQAFNEKVLEVFAAHKSRLAARVAVKRMQDAAMSMIPKASVLEGLAQEEVFSISPHEYKLQEIIRINGYIENRQISKLISCYPIRETPLLGEVARLLGFQNRAKYEMAVRSLLESDEQFKLKAIDVLEPLSGYLLDN